MSDFETATLDAEPETPAGPPMSQEQWNDIQGQIAYLTQQEYAREQEAASEAAEWERQELADLMLVDPEAALQTVHEQSLSYVESQLAPIRQGLESWQQERAIDAANDEITDTLTSAGVPDDELESAYSVANGLVGQGVAEAAAAHGLTVDQFFQVAQQNPELGDALAEFGRAMLADAADHLKSQKEAAGMDEVQLAQSFARRHGLT